MENENRNTAANEDKQNQWQAAEHQGDWQLAESDAEDTAEMLTSYHADAENPSLYAAGDDPEEAEEDDNEEEEIKPDWGHTDPLDSPLPDSTDPSGPGSAV